MRLHVRGFLLASAASLLLAACGGGEDAANLSTPIRPGPDMPARPVADETAQLGAPYQVGGTTYTPEDTVVYDEVGYAHIYADQLEGNATASGEPFVSAGVSAAHKTLPLPSYVEVTALDTGKTILVRINDRGPFSNDRLIDLSRGAAEQLGLTGEGAAPVRVRRVNPPEQERAALRAHGRAAERLETPAPLLVALRKRLGARPIQTTPAPVRASAGRSKPVRSPAGTSYSPPPAERPLPAPLTRSSGDFIIEEEDAGRSTAPAPASAAAGSMTGTVAAESQNGGATGYIVQIASFSSRERAERLARSIGAEIVEGQGVWRVHYGPYPTQEAAQQAVQLAASKGYANAHIMANDAP